MGYQDGSGLRKPANKAPKSGINERLESTFRPTFTRASGGTSAVAETPRPASKDPAPQSFNARLYAGNENEGKFGNNAMPVSVDIPKPPSALRSIAMSVGSKLATDYAGKALSGSFGSLGDAASFAAGAAGDSFGGALDIMGVPVGDLGSYTPYLGAAYKLVQGEPEAAVGSALGTYAGTALGGPVGGAIGSVVGSYAEPIVSAVNENIVRPIYDTFTSAFDDCFITEATMAGLGVQDDEAEPLKVLRFFRDQVLTGTPQGQQMIAEYENIAPLVVEAVNSRPDAMAIYKQIFTQFIMPSVEAVKAGNYPQALQIYAAMIQAVTPLAQEAMQAEDELDGMEDPAAMAGMEQMGEDAGMVAQSPQMARQAAPQVQAAPPAPMMQGGSALGQFSANDEEEDFPTSVRFGRR